MWCSDGAGGAPPVARDRYSAGRAPRRHNALGAGVRQEARAQPPYRPCAVRCVPQSHQSHRLCVAQGTARRTPRAPRPAKLLPPPRRRGVFGVPRLPHTAPPACLARVATAGNRVARFRSHRAPALRARGRGARARVAMVRPCVAEASEQPAALVPTRSVPPTRSAALCYVPRP